MDGEPEDTGSGYRVTLNKSGNSSYFGDDSSTIFADFIFDSDYRLHIKVFETYKSILKIEMTFLS